MSILMLNKSTNAVNVWFDDIKMVVILEDGRELSLPIGWFPSLRDATNEQRATGGLLVMEKAYIGMNWMKISWLKAYYSTSMSLK